MLNFVGIVLIPLFIVLGILKSYSDPRTRMKKKIIRKLTDEANKNNLLFSEIRLRDNLLFRPTALKHRIFQKKFYELFIESIRDLETEGEIIRMDNWNLAFFQKDREEKWPAYSSKRKKTPAHYGLKKDNPNLYLALKSQESQDLVRSLKDHNQTIAAPYRGAY